MPDFSVGRVGPVAVPFRPDHVLQRIVRMNKMRQFFRCCRLLTKITTDGSNSSDFSVLNTELKMQNKKLLV